MKTTEKIFDLTTGEETIIERDETVDEKKSREKIQAKIQEQNQVIAEQLIAKSALLAQLGITEEQAKLLLS